MTTNLNAGKFIISLDFELLWGMRDKKTPESYGKNILSVHDVIPKTLELFAEHNIKGTFATVGFLFASDKNELTQYTPIPKPNYNNPNLSPYNGHFDLVHETQKSKKLHFAPELIELIKSYPSQEIASHTYSHYYCLEKGQTKEDFKQDMIAAIKIARARNISLNSLVFPRNQFNDEYLQIIHELGITSYRGNERVWFYKASNGNDENLYKRSFRLLDSYINISGHNCYQPSELTKSEPLDIPSSRFLRPYSNKLKYFEKTRLNRILNSMTYAAKHNSIYHLWWHPHNFGANQDKNFNFLAKILEHYSYLKLEYGFESCTMNDLANQLLKTKNG